MKHIFGSLQVHCSFGYRCKCDYAIVKGGECIYNFEQECTNQDVFNNLFNAQQGDDEPVQQQTTPPCSSPSANADRTSA